MAFNKREPDIPTARTLGEIYEIDEHGGFSGWLGEPGEEQEFNPATRVMIPAENIVETERHRIVRGALFYCDVELAGEEIHTIRGIEFIELPPLEPKALEAAAQKWAFLADGDISDDPDD